MAAHFQKFPTHWLMLVSLATAIAYGPAVSGSFVFDDLDNIRGNTALTDFPPDLAWHNPASRWLTTLTFAMNYQISGWDTWSYRVTNIAFHIGCGWLVFLLSKLVLVAYRDNEAEALLPTSHVAWLVAAFWLVHPLPSAAVAYIVQRSEILAACSILGFLVAIIRDSQSDTPGRPWQWIAAAIFAAGICCKTNVVSALPIAMLMDRLLLSDSWIAVLRKRGFLYLLPVTMGTLSLWILLPGLQRGDAGVGFSDEIPTVPIYLATQSQVFWHYIYLCLWPSELSIDYRWPPVESVSAAIPWIVPTLTLLAFGIWRYRKRKLDGWLVLCLFLLLAPTSTLIPITDMAVEHRMYLGSATVIALCVVLANYLISLSPAGIKISPIFGLCLLCILLGCFLLRTFTRAQDWSSAFNLWLSAAKVTPSNPRALQNLTSAAIEEGREPELTAALIQLRLQAVAAGDFAPAVASRLGEEYLKAGNPAKAEPLLLEAVEGLDPSGTTDERQEHAAARINLALVLLERSEFEEAEKHLRAGVRSDPLAAYGFAILGDLLMRKANFAEAAKQFRAALAIQPDWKQVENDLAKAEAALTE